MTWNGVGLGNAIRVVTCFPRAARGARLYHLAWLMKSSGVRSSQSDLLGRLPARALPDRLPHGAGPARGVKGRRTPGAPARERRPAPPGQPGPLPAGRPAMARRAVPADPPPPVGR